MMKHKLLFLVCLFAAIMLGAQSFGTNKDLALRPCHLKNKTFEHYITDSLMPLLNRNNFNSETGLVWVKLFSKNDEERDRDFVDIGVYPCESDYHKAVLVNLCTLSGKDHYYYCRLDSLLVGISTDNPKKFLNVCEGPTVVLKRDDDSFFADNELHIGFDSYSDSLKVIYFHPYFRGWDMPEWFDVEDSTDTGK